MCAARVVSNLFKLYRAEYIAPRAPRIVPVSDAKYIVIDGDGALCNEALADRAYGLRVLSGVLRDVLLTRHKDFTLSKLECRWRTDGQKYSLPDDELPHANWTVLMRVPGFVQLGDLQAAQVTLEANARPQTNPIQAAHLETITGGRCLQSLHRGAYTSLGHSLVTMLRLAEMQALPVDTVRHLIFLSDPKHVPTEHLRTILRIPLQQLSEPTAATDTEDAISGSASQLVI